MHLNLKYMMSLTNKGKFYHRFLVYMCHVLTSFIIQYLAFFLFLQHKFNVFSLSILRAGLSYQCLGVGDKSLIGTVLTDISWCACHRDALALPCLPAAHAHAKLTLSSNTVIIFH